ncbi:hypothetical protein FDUTEX481_06891 [Tolypothrix sp. PCC 7601]|nr:hypothetical protein FDUTEX481_06891 [Tolypothrix sp. PCC 7601]
MLKLKYYNNFSGGVNILPAWKGETPFPQEFFPCIILALPRHYIVLRFFQKLQQIRCL